MADWPGRAADDWWDGLDADRKAQIHKWVAGGAATGPPAPPAGQLDLVEFAAAGDASGTTPLASRT